MALIDELKERRQRALDEAQTLTAQWFDLDERRLKLCQIAADCDTAIAALEPSPAAVMSDDTRERIADFKNKYPGFQAEQETAPAAVTEPEIPEGFTKWEGGECPVPIGTCVEIRTRTPLGPKGIRWTVTEAMPRWSVSDAYDDIIAYRIIEASASAASVPSDDACALPGSVEESRDHSDDASEFSEGEEDDGSEMFEEDGPGYAPVTQAEPPPTNPEADALAKARDHYDPKAMAERERRKSFSIFKREDW